MPLITTVQAARLARVPKGTVYSWVHRGTLRRAGTDRYGHPLYEAADVLRAEQKTRRMPRRLRLLAQARHSLQG